MAQDRASLHDGRASLHEGLLKIWLPFVALIYHLWTIPLRLSFLPEFTLERKYKWYIVLDYLADAFFLVEAYTGGETASRPTLSSSNHSRKSGPHCARCIRSTGGWPPLPACRRRTPRAAAATAAARPPHCLAARHRLRRAAETPWRAAAVRRVPRRSGGGLRRGGGGSRAGS